MTAVLDAIVDVIGAVATVTMPLAVAGLVGSARAFSRAQDRGRD
jgi:hypothetical protein